MSRRRLMQIEAALLLALGLFLLNAACADLGKAVLEAPTYDGESQQHQLGLDVGSDGFLEATPGATTVTGVASPEALSQATSGSESIELEMTRDGDSVTVSCVYRFSEVSDGTCDGLFSATFPIETAGSTADFQVYAFSSVAQAPPTGLTQSVEGSVVLDCGSSIVGVAVSNTGLADLQETARVPVGSGATECSVEIDAFDSEAAASTVSDKSVTHSIIVQALNVASPDCASSLECAPGLLCSPNGECQEGKEGDDGVVTSIHCKTFTINSEGCSDGDAGSFALYPGQCAPGYTFNGFECLGENCVGDGDCPPERPICTERGCSATGEYLDGCNQGFGCRDGLCFGGICGLIQGLGDICTGVAQVCDPSLRCFGNGTCQVPLPVGSGCAINEECQGFPQFNSCIGGTCTAKSGSGGPCEENVDCEIGRFCDAGSCSP